jgi:hypothetical protein
MRRLFLSFILCLISVSAAHAANFELPVTPTNLNSFFYTFTVSTNATDTGVAFHVTITDKRFDIYPESIAAVGTITRKDVTNAVMRGAGVLKEASFAPLKPALPVILKKDKRVWTADFIASHELLNDTNVFFVFGVPGSVKPKGETEPSPAQDFYEVKLQDFARP